MKTIQKILIAHPDSAMRRRLVMLFAAAGFDVRPFATAEAALDGARAEWFDLALVDGACARAAAGSLATGLREIQPTLQLLLMVQKMDLGEVVQGIRHGAAEVVALADDPMPVLRQALAFLRLDGPDAELAALGSEELAALGASLAGTATAESAAAGEGNLETKLLQLIRQNQDLSARVAKLQGENGGLETELHTLLAQSSDTQRLQGELENVRHERELVAATQEAIDEKARALAEMRANIASERSALECERKRVAREAPQRVKTEEELAQVRAELTDWRQRLEQEDDRLASDAVRVRQGSLQLAREKRRWHEDLEMIRAQEANLRTYETRLREMQVALEAERVKLTSGTMAFAQPQSGLDERALREAWAKMQRASEILEAERKNFMDDRLNLREEEKALHQREAKVRDREIKQNLREKAAAKAAAPAPKPSALKSLTRAPMEAVRLALGISGKA